MAGNTYIKDPAAVLDYQFDWSAWLTEGDMISQSTVTASSGLTVVSYDDTSTTVTAWLSGGMVGQAYAVTCQIVTAQGRTDERTINLVVENR